MDIENTEIEAPEVEQVEADAPDPLENDGKESLSEKITKNPDALSDSQISDLEKLEKVKYNGKVISGKELARELKEGSLRLSDYTKKTQAIAEERKYYDNLSIDLPKLRANPALADQFRSVYPEKFHWVLDTLEAKGVKVAEEAINKDLRQQEDKQDWKNDPELQETIEFIREQKLESAKTQVNSVFDKLQSKYPDADDGWVAGALSAQREALREANPGMKMPGLDEKAVEKLFKQSHDSFESRAQAWSARRIGAQKQANESGKGPGAGGAIPGQKPRVARSISEATEFALQDLNSQ